MHDLGQGAATGGRVEDGSKYNSSESWLTQTRLSLSALSWRSCGRRWQSPSRITRKSAGWWRLLRKQIFICFLRIPSLYTPNSRRRWCSARARKKTRRWRARCPVIWNNILKYYFKFRSLLPARAIHKMRPLCYWRCTVDRELTPCVRSITTTTSRSSSLYSRLHAVGIGLAIRAGALNGNKWKERLGTSYPRVVVVRFPWHLIFSSSWKKIWKEKLKK